MPPERDSTQWTSTTIPGAFWGHELFHGLEILGTKLYVAYNAGFQIWDIAGSNAEDPHRDINKDGWRGDFLDFPATGENDLLAWKLYSAIGGLGVSLDAAARDSDLTKVVLRSAVEVVEQNPNITTAVRCDLATPFDGLRAALTYDRELLGTHFAHPLPECSSYSWSNWNKNSSLAFDQ